MQENGDDAMAKNSSGVAAIEEGHGAGSGSVLAGANSIVRPNGLALEGSVGMDGGQPGQELTSLELILLRCQTAYLLGRTSAGSVPAVILRR